MSCSYFKYCANESMYFAQKRILKFFWPQADSHLYIPARLFESTIWVYWQILNYSNTSKTIFVMLAILKLFPFKLHFNNTLGSLMRE